MIELRRKLLIAFELQATDKYSHKLYEQIVEVSLCFHRRKECLNVLVSFLWILRINKLPSINKLSKWDTKYILQETCAQ